MCPQQLGPAGGVESGAAPRWQLPPWNNLPGRRGLGSPWPRLWTGSSGLLTILTPRSVEPLVG